MAPADSWAWLARLPRLAPAVVSIGMLSFEREHVDSMRLDVRYVIVEYAMLQYVGKLIGGSSGIFQPSPVCAKRLV